MPGVRNGEHRHRGFLKVGLVSGFCQAPFVPPGNCTFNGVSIPFTAQRSKQFDRRRRKPRIVIVCVDVLCDSARLDIFTNIHPRLQLRGAIDDRGVPRCGQLLDVLTIAKPSDVRKVCGYQIIVLKVLWVGHPRLILKDQRDVVLAKQVKQPGFQPVFVSDLNSKSKPTGAWQLLEEGLEPRHELYGA